MKAADLREKSENDLQKELHNSLKEQFNLRMQRGAGQPPKPQMFRNVRKLIARIKTILNEKGVKV